MIEIEISLSVARATGLSMKVDHDPPDPDPLVEAYRGGERSLRMTTSCSLSRTDAERLLVRLHEAEAVERTREAVRKTIQKLSAALLSGQQTATLVNVSDNDQRCSHCRAPNVPGFTAHDNRPREAGGQILYTACKPCLEAWAFERDLKIYVARYQANLPSLWKRNKRDAEKGERTRQQMARGRSQNAR